MDLRFLFCLEETCLSLQVLFLLVKFGKGLLLAKIEHVLFGAEGLQVP
jgi:hypothetical protein